MAHHTTARHYLLINPNTSPQTTERLRQVLLPQLPTGVTLDVCTARFGASYIACEASHAVASHACLDAWAHHRTQAAAAPLHGVLIGCFGDPGLFALRESSACPVTGLAEASFLQAAALGPFAIVTGGERWQPMLRRLAQNLGFGDALRHIETVAPSGAALQGDPDMALRCLRDACAQAVHHGVKSIVLGGAGLAGYADALRSHCPLPLFDSACCGLQVLLQQQAPPARRATDGLVAHWQHMPEALSRLT